MKYTSLIAVFEGGTGMSAYILSVPSARCWFRWAVREAAARNDVTGWVRNLSDGRVELVAEGERPELEASLANANLANAHLAKANLTGAYLKGANLTEADLNNANLTNATLDDAIWGNTTCPDGTNSNDPGNSTCRF